MRILIIGTGSIGRRHAEVAQRDGHEIALCDVDRQSVAETAETFHVKEYYYDYREALSAGFDAAIICTPNAYHAEQGIFAMSKNCHVLMEKPIATTSIDGEQLVAAAKRHGKTLMVGYILRAYPGLERIKAIIGSGRLGNPVSARVMLSAANTLVLGRSDYRRSYETGGGIIFDFSHEIDYLRYFFGEPKRVACFKDLRVRAGVSCDDVAEIIMQFESGVLAGLHMDYIQECGEYRHRRIVEIICEKGFIWYDFENLRVQSNDGNEEHIKYEDERNDLFLKQLRTFAAACDGLDVSYVTGEDATNTVRICEDLYKYDREAPDKV